MKSAISTVPVRSLVEPIETWNPSRAGGDEFFDYIDLSSVDSETKSISGTRSLACSEAPSRARQLVATKDILVSTVRPNLNGVAPVPEKLDGATASTGFCVLRSNCSKLNDRYLSHWVRSPEFVSDMVSLATGANYPAVSVRIILDSKIPLPHKNGKPDLDEQKRIAAILDKADGIRRKRQQALRLTDDFLRSVFLDMFGDPVTNPMGWDEDDLKSLGKIITGSTPPSKKDGMFDGDTPFVTPGDLKEGPVSSRRTVTTEGAKHSRVVRSGATFVCCIGATIGKMGKAATRSAFNQQINAIEWDHRVSDDYGLEALKFFKSTIAMRGSSTTLPILNKSSFQSLRIPVPPRDLQQKFSATIALSEVSRGRHEAANNKSEDLFSSLQQRAFRGGL